MTVSFVVHGMPAPQGSKRLVGRDRKGRGILVESSKAVKPWREAVKFAALARIAELSLSAPLDGPVVLTVVFALPRPKSYPKSRIYPDARPDLSKLVRSTEDALVDSGLITDDARIVAVFARKAFPGTDALSLDSPGAFVEISQEHLPRLPWV